MKKSKRKLIIPDKFDILLALIGVSFCGIGAGFTKCASLGLDSIGIFYDGIRNVIGFPVDMLGVASFIVNGIIITFLFFASRKYVSLGTLIYIIAYGSFVTIGTIIYNAVFVENILIIRILFSFIGFMILYIGIGIFVAIDIGVDAFTGLVLFLSDITHFEMKYVNIAFVLILIIIGAVIGGEFGAATFITMIAAGPLITLFSKKFQAIYFKIKLRKEKMS